MPCSRRSSSWEAILIGELRSSLSREPPGSYIRCQEGRPASALAGALEALPTDPAFPPRQGRYHLAAFDLCNRLQLVTCLMFHSPSPWLGVSHANVIRSRTTRASVTGGDTLFLHGPRVGLAKGRGLSPRTVLVIVDNDRAPMDAVNLHHNDADIAKFRKIPVAASLGNSAVSPRFLTSFSLSMREASSRLSSHFSRARPAYRPGRYGSRDARGPPPRLSPRSSRLPSARGSACIICCIA